MKDTQAYGYSRWSYWCYHRTSGEKNQGKRCNYKRDYLGTADRLGEENAIWPSRRSLRVESASFLRASVLEIYFQCVGGWEGDGSLKEHILPVVIPTLYLLFASQSQFSLLFGVIVELLRILEQELPVGYLHQILRVFFFPSIGLLQPRFYSPEIQSDIEVSLKILAVWIKTNWNKDVPKNKGRCMRLNVTSLKNVRHCSESPHCE